MRLRPERHVVGTIPEEKDSMTARLAIWKFMEAISYKVLEGDRFALAERFEDKFRKTRGSIHTNLLGLGVSAYSHTCGLFFQNPRRIGGTLRNDSKEATLEYISKVESGNISINWVFRMGGDEMLAGEFALGLKKGIDLYHLFVGRYDGVPGCGVYVMYINPLAEPLKGNGLVNVTDNYMTLTRKGRLLENEICSLFYTPRVIALAAARRGTITPSLDSFAKEYEFQYALETNNFR